MTKKYQIAVIPGDGIGEEVMPEGLRVLEAVASKFSIDIQFNHHDFACCDYYLKHGQMMPDNWFDTLVTQDAIFFGAVGMPKLVPDHISLWGSLIQFRKRFDQYVNLRPVKLIQGVPSPLANRQPGEIDFYVVRENTEGEYSNAGGILFAGTDREFAIQETVMTRQGVDRILKYAFELASKRSKKHLTSATKSNGISITMPYWDTRVANMAQSYPDIRVDQYHIDILTAFFVLKPHLFDVVVGSNLFGDILTDIAAAICGGIGLAASGNINPTGKFPSMFEPVHGSAPDIAGKNIADPTATVMSVAMMLDHLGLSDAARDVERAVAADLATRGEKNRSTSEVGDALVAAL